MNIEFKGLDEFKNVLGQIEEEFPKETRGALNKISLEAKKQLIEDSPESPYTHKNKLVDSWKKKVVENESGELEAQIWAKSPHFHLVNRGHVIKDKSGKVKGFQQGLFFLEKRMEKIEANETPEQLNKLMKKIQSKIKKNTRQG